MIEKFIVYIQLIISEYGAWGVFFATLIEEIIAPIPSPLVPLAAGFFFLPANISFTEIAFNTAIIIAFPVALGISIGSVLVYSIGFFGGKPVIEKSKKLTGINWRDIEKTETRLTRGKGDEITLFILRILPIVPGVAISGFCGIVRYPIKKFIIITYFGAFVRAFLLGIIGWQVGELYINYANIITNFEKYIFFSILFLLIIFLFISFILKKSSYRKKNK